MNGNKSIINTNEICNIFKEYCEKENEEFNESKFEKFLEFLEIDFYDWVKKIYTCRIPIMAKVRKVF